jgi:O-antigen/teichoic acid export membrane protein
MEPQSRKSRFSGPLTRLMENELMRRLIKNAGYLFGANGISAAISMLQGILAARLLGVEQFGVLGVITMFASVVNKFMSFRMGELVVRYVGLYTEAGDKPRAAAVFKAAALAEMAASIVAFFIIWILSPFGATYFAKDPSLAGLFAFYGLIVLANLMAESSAGLLQIFDHFRPIAALNIGQSLVTLLIIVIVYLNDGGLFGILFAYVAGKVFGALGITLAAIREATRHWGRGWWLAPLSLLQDRSRELTTFATSTYISASLSIINKDSELLWVSFFRSPVEAGYYKLALALANLVQMPIIPMPQATYPELSREVARRNWINVRYILRQGSFLAGGYSLLATSFLVLFGRPIISWLYKPEFLPAFPALVILLAGFLIANTFYWQRVALLALGRPDFPMKINLVLAGLKVILILLLVPQYGYLASAALLAGSYAVGVSISAWKAFSVLRQKEMMFPEGTPAG